MFNNILNCVQASFTPPKLLRKVCMKLLGRFLTHLIMPVSSFVRTGRVEILDAFGRLVNGGTITCFWKVALEKHEVGIFRVFHFPLCHSPTKSFPSFPITTTQQTSHESSQRKIEILIFRCFILIRRSLSTRSVYFRELLCEIENFHTIKE